MTNIIIVIPIGLFTHISPVLVRNGNGGWRQRETVQYMVTISVYCVSCLQYALHLIIDAKRFIRLFCAIESKNKTIAYKYSIFIGFHWEMKREIRWTVKWVRHEIQFCIDRARSQKAIKTLTNLFIPLGNIEYCYPNNKKKKPNTFIALTSWAKQYSLSPIHMNWK